MCKAITKGWVILILLIMVTGCFESEQILIVNPDGSGKILINRLEPVGILSQTENGLEEQAKRKVKKIIEEFKGVEAWEDVRYEINKKGQLHFQGTAYFRDFDTLNMTGDGMQWLMTREEETLVFKLQKEEKRKEPFALSDEDALKRLKSQRLKAAQMRPMIENLIKDMRIKRTLQVAADPVKTLNVFAENTRRFTIEIKGSQIIELMDRFEARDDAWWLEQLKRAAAAGYDDPASMIWLEELLGNEELPTVVIPVEGEPVFDYAAEVKDAREGYDQLKELLKIDGLKIPGDAE